MIVEAVIVTGALLAAATPAPVSNPEPVELAESFLTAVGKGESDKALDGLPKGALWASQQQRLEMLRGQIKTGMTLYGTYLDFEKVREVRYTSSVTRLVYVM